MKKTILSIAVIAAAIFAASCQKENLQENTASEGSASVFTATIETGASTKTTVERVTSPSVAYKTYWDNTDKISINGVIYTATPDVTDATKATFAKDPDTQTDPTGTFKAYFPEKLFTQIKGNVIISLPPTYPYVEGKYNMPMYAESDNTTLSFKNLCGVLAIKVHHSVFPSIKSIEVSSDKQMNGEFTATADGTLTFKTEGVTLTDDNKKVTLTFVSEKAIASDGSATFYIPVPAGTHKPLKIKVSDGTTIKEMDTKNADGVTIARNMVYPITFADNSNDPGFVEMKMGTGTSKLIWATKNLGAISIASCGETCFGDYYAWGETEPHYTTRSWNESGKKCTFDNWNSGKTEGYVLNSYWGKDLFESWEEGRTLPTEQDVVTLKLGDGWRMPTAKDFSDLCEACGLTIVDNDPTRPITILKSNGSKSTTDKGVYWCDNYDGIKGVLFIAENNGAHLFFPAAGVINGNTHMNSESAGYYWSNTYCQISNNKPNSITLQILNNKIYPNAINFISWLGIPIRPVKDVPTTE